MEYQEGEVPLSADSNGVVRVYREESEVFRVETISSVNGKPLVNDHPPLDVTPESWSRLTHGILLNARRGEGEDSDLLLADILVTTPQMIRLIREEGKIELSCGYDADYEQISEGQGRQKNIVVNHVALVDNGRCGSRCSIQDSKGYDMTNDDKKEDEVKEDPTKEEPTKEEQRFTDDDFKKHVEQNKKEHEEMYARISALEKSKPQTKDDDDEEKPEKTKDSSFVSETFKKTVAYAEILVPGVHLPTLDSLKGKRLYDFQRKVLDQFYSTQEGREIISDLSPTDYRSLTCDSLAVLFNSAAKVKTASNNKPEVSFHKVEKYPHIKSIDDLNAFNEKFWGLK